MQRRLATVTRNAFGERISSPEERALCQRMNVSWRTSSASATLPSIRYATENRSARCSSKAASVTVPSFVALDSERPALMAGSGGPHDRRLRGEPGSVVGVRKRSRLVRMKPPEVGVRDGQCGEEEERIDDEEPGVADGEVRDRGRDQRDRETGIGELPDLRRQPRPQE